MTTGENAMKKRDTEERAQEPMVLMALRIPRAEKDRFMRLARLKGTTLSAAMREGARLILNLGACPDCHSDDPTRRGTLYPVSERGFCQHDWHGAHS